MYPWNGTIPNWSLWTPSLNLTRTDGDTVVVFLSANRVLFTENTQDSWYMRTGRNVTDGPVLYYMSSEPASPLACVNRYQICTSPQIDSQNCTQLVGFLDLLSAASRLSDDPNTHMRLAWIWNVLSSAYDFRSIVQTLGLQSLTSRHNFYTGYQGPLSGNQWQLDVQYWHNIQMSSIQQGFTRAALGPTDTEILKSWRGPVNDVERQLCGSQASKMMR